MGMTMSMRRRLELLEWAKAHGAAIVEDDYDSDFHDDAGVIPLHTSTMSSRWSTSAASPSRCRRFSGWASSSRHHRYNQLSTSPNS